MVRFSCFNGHIHSSKTKKSVQPSFEAYHKTLQDSTRDHVSESLKKKTASPLLNSQSDSQVSDETKNVASVDCSLKLEDMKNKFVLESETTPRKGQLKKSQSLGSGLYNEGRGSMDDDIEDETYPEYSCDYSNDHVEVGVIEGRKDREVSPPYQDENSQTYETFPENNEIIFNNSIFSIGEEQPHLEREPQENYDTPVSGECGAAVSFLHTPRGVVKSCSLPNLGATVSTPTSGCHANLGLRSRSLEDVRFQEKKWKDCLIYEMEKVTIQGQVHEADMIKAEKIASENFGDDNYDSCHYSSSAKDWVMPAVEKVGSEKNFLEEPRIQQWVVLPNKDFKIKRIEDWVSDLQHCGPLEEIDKKLDFEDEIGGDSNVSSGLASSKIEDKVNPGSETAKRYISSLNATATTAQLVNHGLVLIPFLSAFVSLRVLNLSGNAIVRITAGALPRGLHTLNLSKNNISTIEGLRELTRLRILDLSYNRILRIGHGLASCSSLKELYLAGNKISEVEGLHRLLKLTVLDLRFNKISTAKCLGQLAANYNSLQAISLEGNPAQKNVGDDQLKKYLQSLLPHLAYYNRQTIKVGSLKDSSERSVRIGASSHGVSRLDHSKASRKGPRPSSSSALGRGSQAALALLKPASKSRHARLPPAATKPTSSSNRQQHHHHHVDIATRITNLRQELSSKMRRSWSEGTLGAL